MGIDWIARAQALTPQVRNFVDGRYQSVSGATAIEKFSPRDGRRLCRFGAGEERQVNEAVSSARCAFEDGRWSSLTVQRRKDVLHALASLIEAHREELALLECLDVGKPISDPLGFDVPAAAAIIRFNAEAADKFYGRVYEADRTSLSYELHRPIGVVGAIVGWNFPLLLAAGKIGPALAMGNALVLKPSELTSFSAARIAELALEAGVPEGVFNVIHGNGKVGAALAHHPDVDLVSFTGSTHTGKQLLIASGQSNMKRLVLECGGKAPNIVFDDSPDLDSVADAIVARAFYNQGQVCTASSRLLVQRDVKDDLLSRVVKKVATLIPGDPLNTETRYGAVVSAAHRQKIQHYIDRGVKDRIWRARPSDSPPPFESGYYVSPVIFDEVPVDHPLAKEEIFGPVLSVLPFKDEAEAIHLANSTIYGLSAIVWTRDLGRAHRMTQGIHAGWITVNATGRPVGGPGAGVLSVGGHRQSGLSAEGGLEGLEAYTRKTAVQVFV